MPLYNIRILCETTVVVFVPDGQKSQHAEDYAQRNIQEIIRDDLPNMDCSTIAINQVRSASSLIDGWTQEALPYRADHSNNMTIADILAKETS